jgi:hypothetical protein
MSAPLRIHRQPSGGVVQTSSARDSGDVYMERLVKLVPSEVIGIFLAGKGYADAWIGTWAAICMVLVLISRIWGTYEKGKPIQWIGVAVSFVSFAIWIYAIGAHILNFVLPDNGIAYIAVLVWTFIVPYFYKGD